MQSSNWRHIWYITLWLMGGLILFLLTSFVGKWDRFSVNLQKENPLISWYNEVLERLNQLSWALTTEDLATLDKATISTYQKLSESAQKTNEKIPRLQALAQAKECVTAIASIDQTRKSINDRNDLVMDLLEKQVRLLPNFALKLNNKSSRQCLVEYRSTISHVVSEYTTIMWERKSFTASNEKELGDYPSYLWSCPRIIAIKQQTQKRDQWTKNVQKYHETVVATLEWSGSMDQLCRATSEIRRELWTWSIIKPLLVPIGSWINKAIEWINEKIKANSGSFWSGTIQNRFKKKTTTWEN